MMNYYNELIETIEDSIKEEDFHEARRLIINELNMPYVPRDIEEKLNDYLKIVDQHFQRNESLSEEQIAEFLLNGDEQHQLLAVSKLDKMNLRDHVDLCEQYLLKDASINARALLIDSLIAQQIDHEFHYKNKDRMISFTPSRMVRVTETKSFQYCISRLNDDLMKEPSKLKLAGQLLYKEFMLNLPEEIKTENCDRIVSHIEEYIEDAFEADLSAKKVTE